jgi:hypothetical protein
MFLVPISGLEYISSTFNVFFLLFSYFSYQFTYHTSPRPPSNEFFAETTQLLISILDSIISAKIHLKFFVINATIYPRAFRFIDINPVPAHPLCVSPLRKQTTWSSYPHACQPDKPPFILYCNPLPSFL